MIPDHIKLSTSTNNIIQEGIRHYINMSSSQEQSAEETSTSSIASQEAVNQTSQTTTNMSTADHQAHEASGPLQAEQHEQIEQDVQDVQVQDEQDKQSEKTKKTDVQDVCSEIDKRIIQLKADLRRIQLRLQDHWWYMDWGLRNWGSTSPHPPLLVQIL